MYKAPTYNKVKVDIIKSLKLKLPKTYNSSRSDLSTFFLQLRLYTKFNDNKFNDLDKDNKQVL